MYNSKIHPNTSHQVLIKLACRVNTCISQLDRYVIGKYSNPKGRLPSTLRVPSAVRRLTTVNKPSMQVGKATS